MSAVVVNGVFTRQSRYRLAGWDTVTKVDVKTRGSIFQLVKS
jgi:hypothetical protein